MEYRIYQINAEKIEKGFKDISFRHFKEEYELKVENMKKFGYNMSYNGSIDKGNNTISNVLENIFYIFNMECPNDFSGRPLATSDIIKLDDNYYYCDGIGWKLII